jgi:hypothetical protein
MSTDTQVRNLCGWCHAFTKLTSRTQVKVLFVNLSCEVWSSTNILRSDVETNFYATFKPSISVSSSQVQLNINGIWAAAVGGFGFTPDTELKGKIHIQPNITEIPNSYLIATVGSVIIFVFRARSPDGPIVGGATFPNPFKTNIDWRGNLEWKPLVPIPPKVGGPELVGSNATPE